MNMNYKSEYLNTLSDNIHVKLHTIDNALQTCLDDYYEACETSNMLGDTMKLFAAVQGFSVAIKHDSERDDAWMVRDLIVAEMREREWEVESKYTDDELWNQYVDTLKKNMEYELERVLYARKRFCEDSEIFGNLFGNL